MAPRSIRFGVRALAFVVIVAALEGARAGAQQFDNFNVNAWQGITMGPDGALWLPIGQFSIGRMTTNGNVTNVSPLPIGITQPTGITTGSDGNLWFTTRVPSAIGRITPSGTITMFGLPLPSLPYAITGGSDGNLWFTLQGTNRIGRMTTSGSFTDYQVPTGFSGLAGITAGPDGNLWFTENLAGRIGRITTAGVIDEFPLAGDPRPAGIVTGPDGNIWFTEQRAARVGRITPEGVITEFPAPPFAAGIGSAYGALWLARPGEITRVTTSGNTESFNVPLFVPSAVGVTTDSDGRLWVTDFIPPAFGHVVRVTDTQPDTCVPDNTTLCLNDGRFRVRAAFRTGGPVQEARAVGLTADSGYFWFFNPANIEIVVKVLDGCAVNNHYWNFLAGLTNVEVTTTVTDTLSGETKVYTNQAGTPFAPVQDTSAFATCP